MESVDVGVGGKYDLVITQRFDVFFDLECLHEVINFDVFIEGIAVEVADVEGFAFESEDGLVVSVAAADEGAGSGLSFGNKNLGIEVFLFGVIVVMFAVFELRDANRDRFGAFPSQFFDGVEFFA